MLAKQMLLEKTDRPTAAVIQVVDLVVPHLVRALCSGCRDMHKECIETRMSIHALISPGGSRWSASQPFTASPIWTMKCIKNTHSMDLHFTQVILTHTIPPFLVLTALCTLHAFSIGMQSLAHN